MQIITASERTIPSCVPTTASVNCGGTESFPHNCLTDVGGYEKRDAWSEAISLLQQLIK